MAHVTPEQRQAWKEKKLKEDPEYFRRKNREYRRNHPEKVKEYRKRYLEKHPDAYKKSYAKSQKKNLPRLRAKIYAQRYTTLKTECENCGATENLEGHHADYSKPLEVTTLCKKCHEALHAKLRAEGKTPKRPKPEVFKNRHCSTCAKTVETCQRKRPSFKGRPCSLWEEKKNNGEKKDV